MYRPAGHEGPPEARSRHGAPLRTDPPPRHADRPIGLNAGAYRSGGVIKRGHSDVEPSRDLATRFDKLALTYRGRADLRAITQWLNYLV